MRTVVVKMPHGEGEWIILSNPDELLEYSAHVSEKVVEQTSRLLKSQSNPSRWDHMITATPEGSILAGALAECQIKGGRPLLAMDSIMQRKFMNMLEHIIKGEEVLVNRRGGYCTMHKDFEILSTSVLDTSFKPTHVINENTTYINLENDPELEARTKQYLGERDPNFSYVLNLRKYDKDSLVAVFSDFKAKGGKIVHVYTTGMDVPQMYEYFEAAQVAGLNDFVFEYNSGISDGIQGFINHTKKLANVEIVGE
jgi:hypothetical protein